MPKHSASTVAKTDTAKKPVNVMLEEDLYWKGREHAARVRLPHISALLERLLEDELKHPTLPKSKAA